MQGVSQRWCAGASAELCNSPLPSVCKAEKALQAENCSSKVLICGYHGTDCHCPLLTRRFIRCPSSPTKESWRRRRAGRAAATRRKIFRSLLGFLEPNSSSSHQAKARSPVGALQFPTAKTARRASSRRALPSSPPRQSHFPLCLLVLPMGGPIALGAKPHSSLPRSFICPLTIAKHALLRWGRGSCSCSPHSSPTGKVAYILSFVTADMSRLPLLQAVDDSTPRPPTADLHRWVLPRHPAPPPLCSRICLPSP